MQQIGEDVSSMSRRQQSVQIKRAIRAKFPALAASDLSLSWGRGTAWGWLHLRVRKTHYLRPVSNFLEEQFDWSGYAYLNLSVTDWDGRSWLGDSTTDNGDKHDWKSLGF